MSHIFNLNRATQAAAHVVKQHGGQISRIRLLKLLYIAERECLKESLRPLLSDRVVAMQNGPVLSEVYDLLKGSFFSQPKWDQVIQQSGSYMHSLVADPGVGQLNRFEVDKLTIVCQRYSHLDDWDVAEATHQFEEWKQHRPENGGSKIIPLEDMLRAVGRGECVTELDQKREEDASVDRIFG